MDTLFPLFLACAVHVISVSCQSGKDSLYLKCDPGNTYTGNVTRQLTSAQVRCFEACTLEDTCLSVNVCPASQTNGQWDCELLDSYSPWACRRLDAATNPLCYYAEKKTHCSANGGRVRNDSSCRCDVCFKGERCTERVRDCQEAIEVMAQDGGYDREEMCFIQPTGSPGPVLVRCPFTGQKTTPILLRVQEASGWSQLSWPDYRWNDFERGMGSYDVYNFFVGLESLRHLLAQAEYRMIVFNVYQPPPPEESPAVSAAFRNVTLRDGDNKYALSYDLYSTTDGSAADLQSFQGSGISHPFCTVDNDCGACAQTQGPGWYYVTGNGSCVGNSPFAPIAKWPYGASGLLTIKETSYFLERIGDFY